MELALLTAEQRRLELSPSKLPDVEAQVELAVQSYLPIIESQLTVDKLQAEVDQLQKPTDEREDENDAFAELKRELDERRAVLKQLKEDQRDVLRRKHTALHAEEQFQTQQSLRSKISSLNVKKGVLRNRLDAAEKQLEADEEKLISLEFMLAELDREKQVLELIAARKLRLETERNAPERVALMSSARPPECPDPKVAWWKLGLVCGLAFLLPLVVVGCWPARAA